MRLENVCRIREIVFCIDQSTMPPTRMAYRRHASSAVPILASLSKLFTLASPTNLRAGHEYLMSEGGGDEPEDKPDSPVFWWKLGFSACLVLAGGVFAGYVFTFIT